jgi:hypothetical protein
VPDQKKDLRLELFSVLSTANTRLTLGLLPEKHPRVATFGIGGQIGPLPAMASTSDFFAPMRTVFGVAGPDNRFHLAILPHEAIYKSCKS